MIMNLGDPGSPIELTKENLVQVLEQFKYVLDNQPVRRGRWTVEVYRRRSKRRMKKRARKKFARAGGRLRPAWVEYV